MLKLVDVTGNSRMTMSTQLQPKTASNTIEEGIRGMTPSSSEFSFHANYGATCSIAMHTNIKHHANQHRTPLVNTSKQRQKHQSETETEPQTQTEK